MTRWLAQEAGGEALPQAYQIHARESRQGELRRLPASHRLGLPARLRPLPPSRPLPLAVRGASTDVQPGEQLGAGGGGGERPRADGGEAGVAEGVARRVGDGKPKRG